MIKRQLGRPIEGEYGAEFVARFPEVRDAVRVARPQLDWRD
jgi:hypothetical protein